MVSRLTWPLLSGCPPQATNASMRSLSWSIFSILVFWFSTTLRNSPKSIDPLMLSSTSLIIYQSHNYLWCFISPIIWEKRLSELTAHLEQFLFCRHLTHRFKNLAKLPDVNCPASIFVESQKCIATRVDVMLTKHIRLLKSEKYDNSDYRL
mmetsp:Transcript_5370/g.11024  ORF Transcript_5370/g.11024 Transcript_5370/m.11024 type:complete len:151 (-) Transcript_5370:22-474(-)